MSTANSLNDLLSRVSLPVAQERRSPPAAPVAPAVALSDRMTLGEFVRRYLERRTDVKPSTRINLRRAEFNLVAYFGADRFLDEITEGDADEWRLWLGREVTEGEKLVHHKLAENTIRRLCGRARQFFHAAVKRRLIGANPFSEMKGIMMRGNKSREYFITREEAKTVLDACPTAEWRIIFALARFGGLRTPSETLSLRWSDIDWARGRITVHSPKTEHHDGGDQRIMPLFPEIRIELELIHKPGAKGYIIDERRRRAAQGINGWANSNLRTMFEKIVWRSGLKPWPKLFHNLRATRQTELCETFPAHCVCSWLGNSLIIAQRHYLQTTDEHFAAAVGPQEGGAR